MIWFRKGKYFMLKFSTYYLALQKKEKKKNLCWKAFFYKKENFLKFKSKSWTI